MTIELTPEHERLIKRVIYSGAYHDARDVIGAALEALAEALGDVEAAKARADEPRVSLEDMEAKWRTAAIERLRTFGKTHALSLGGITLRQLRHEARP